MKIDNPTGDRRCHKPHYRVTFEERRVEDLRFDYPKKAFERVRQISDFNEALYRTFASPWIEVAVTPWTAAVMKWLHPMRASRYLLSERFFPWMHLIALAAEPTRRSRMDVDDDNAFRAAERRFSGKVTKAIEALREERDRLEEDAFRRLYG